MILEMFGCKRC